MKNNYSFWEKYLKETINRIEQLLLEKDKIYVDFHIHSNYSADSNQSLEDIINRTAQLGIDIISITDHDSVDVYDELYHYIVNNQNNKPIIVPGIEFTVDNKEYGSQFHILQLMINPKSNEIINDVNYQKRASWIRVKKQFERLDNNKAMQYFFKKYHFNCTIDKYKDYLNTCFRPIPEYKTLMEYILSEVKEYGITNWDILKQMKKWNDIDKCNERKELKKIAYKKLENKYYGVKESNYNSRFFHCLLAIRGADDDFFSEYETTGDLSVNNYEQIKLNQLNKKNMTFFAHPSENKLDLLENLVKMNDSVCGMELNKRCQYSNIELFYKKVKYLNMIKIIGSDSHDIDSDLYNDLEFYIFDKKDIINFINISKNYINKSKIVS